MSGRQVHQLPHVLEGVTWVEWLGRVELKMYWTMDEGKTWQLVMKCWREDLQLYEQLLWSDLQGGIEGVAGAV